MKRDAEEDTSKYKKPSTKKPTQPNKPKPTSAPFKTPSHIQASPSSIDVSQSEVNSHAPSSSAALHDTTDPSIIPPEDATLPPNASSTVSYSNISVFFMYMHFYFLLLNLVTSDTVSQGSTLYSPYFCFSFHLNDSFY